MNFPTGPVANPRVRDNQREKIYEMWTTLKADSQFATMWTPVESWLHAEAIQRGVPSPKSNDPDPERPGAPVGATFRWMEQTGRRQALTLSTPKWFRDELGIGTAESYFGPRQMKLRSRRLKQIAEAARVAADEEKREILSRTTRT